jgi:Ca-activated chloride channel family protein
MMNTFIKTILILVGSVFTFRMLQPVFRSPITSPEAALQRIERDMLPSIEVKIPSGITMDPAVKTPAVVTVADRLPAVEAFPLYGADGLPQNPGPGVLRIEIVSSVEKADGQHPENRWLVDVAERFNQRRERIGGGPPIEVVVRAIPSGLGAQMLAAGKMRPAGYSPAGQSWLELLRHGGVSTTLITDKLVANTSVIAVRPSAWRQLNQGQPDSIRFGQVVDQTLAGNLKLGYSNPYISSAGLDFLQTLLWVSAGHGQDHKPLTATELSRPQITKGFDLLQQRVVGTTPTYTQSVQIWKGQPSRFDAVVMAHQSFSQLKKEPGFADLVEVPFGTPQNSPLAAFPWTTAQQRQALERFAQFATSEPMQALARQRGYGEPEGITPDAKPPQADGALLSQAQALWKQRKDGGRTVYLELVIDTSGSMNEQQRLNQLKKAITLATTAINDGNQVGLISFSDHPVRQMPLQPINAQGRRQLVASINSLQADGPTALYDGLAVGMADLLRARQKDPNGRFHLLLLTDGQRTDGLELKDMREVIEKSGIVISPIAYGEVNEGELKSIAELRESVVYQGTPALVLPLMNDLFQTNL